MIYTKDIQVTEKHITALQCNRCNKMILPDDIIEWQEFISWELVGGYSSVWGDGSRVRIDLCQKCAYELLHEYAEDLPE